MFNIIFINIINIIIFITNKFEKKNIITIEKNYRFDLKSKIKNCCCCCCCCCRRRRHHRCCYSYYYYYDY
jgi:hypothetical protein